MKRIMCGKGTPEQFKAALQDKIAELSGEQPINSSEDMEFASVNPGDERYFLLLKNGVVDILTKSFAVDATGVFEGYGIRFELYVPGTYDLLCEDVVLYEDCVPNIEDIEYDAQQVAENLVSMCNREDPEYENEDWEDLEDEEID